MKNNIIRTVLLLFCLSHYSWAQLDGNLLLGLTNATTAEINAVTGVAKGALVFNSDSNEVYVYNGTLWEPMGGPRVHMGVVTITGTGNVTVTGIPFEPSQISFVAHANVESLNLNADNGVGNNNSGLNNSFGSMNGFARNKIGSIEQRVIYLGGSGNSINDISRFASSNLCIGIRYGNQNGNNLGITSASLQSFNNDGFTLNVNSHVDNLVVLYTAYNK